MPRGGQNKICRRELVRDLTGLARTLGKAPTQSEYLEHGEYSLSPIRTEFGTWSAAKDELDLEVYHRNNTAVTVACAVCGTDVEKKPSRVESAEYLYCGRECADEHKRERYSGDGNPRFNSETVACSNCGDELVRPKWHRESREYHFCDYECMGEWREGRFVGEENPEWIDFPVLECEYCGKSYKIKPSEKGRSRFCSRRCKDIHNFTGSGNPRWKGGPITKECENCGDKYQVKPSEADESSYCSFDCLHEGWNPTGPDHPRWNPDSDRLYYGPDWVEQRRKAIIRDQARCQNPKCRMTEPDNLAWCGVGLDVHHKKSLRSFKEEGEDDEIDYSVSNALSNLISLCRDCHREVESDSHGLTV